MFVDGKRFITYELDSKDTIKERIALEKKILPEHIIFTFSKDEGGVDNVFTQTLPQIMDKYKPFQFEQFYEENKDNFKSIDFESMANLWYINVMKEGKASDPYAEILLNEFLKKNRYALDRLVSNIEQFKKAQKSKFDSFSTKVQKDTQIVSELEKHKQTHTTPIEVVKVKTEVSFEVDYDIYELFNYIKMSRDVPFAVIGEYYKILKDFIPLDKWTYTRERLEGDFGDKREVLYLKTLNVRNEPIKNFQQTNPNLYSTVSIYFETPQEETKRKREERLKKEEEIERERKKEEKKRKEEARKKKEEEPKKKIIRKKKLEDIEKDKAKREKEEKEREKTERERAKKEREEREKADMERKERDLDDDSIIRSSKVYLRVDSNINPEFTEDELIDRIISTFPGKIHILSKRQIQIKAEFLVPQFHLDRPIFLDMIMNNPVFSRLCFVDERMRLQKEKGGIYLYFAFSPDDPDDKLITCSMTEQIVEKTSLKVISKDPELKIDTPYLKVRITKALDREIAEDFKNIFSRLITLYKSKKDEVVNVYKKYIDNFEDIIEDMREDIEKKRRKSTRTRKMLKDIDPDQFISGYSRWLCPTKRAPKIIATKDNPDDPEPKEVTDLEDKNIQVMLFPKTNIENGNTYNQYYYSCDHHFQDKYPGLRINKLSNSEKYPIVPCCYKKDHRSKKKSIWRSYYEEGKNFDDFRKKEDVDDEEDEKHIYSTNKILPSKRYGILVKNIEAYFASIDINNKYLRQGVTRSYNSIIETLMMAMDPDFDGYNTNQLKNRVEEIREELVDIAENSDIYQQAYTYTPDTIKLYLKDNKKYLDPKIFIRLLEDYFHCYIFIFSQNEQYPYGILNCPHHVKEYLQLKKNKTYPTVFIYEHMGAELDRAEYPQCELIVQVDDKNEKEFTFSSKYEVVIRTNEIFKEMYFTDEKDSDIIVSFNATIVRQDIDYHGKTRFLQFDNEICVLTDPLPPISISQGCKYKTISWNRAKEFLDDEKATKIKEHIISGKRVGVHASKGNVNFYIPLEPEETKEDNQIDVITPTFILPKSELSIYNEYHRRARCLTEYMLYLFSLDYRKYKPAIINSKYVEEFVKRNIDIDSSFVYKNVPRLFSMNDSGILRNKKLVIHNISTLKKLLYVLRVKMRNNIEEVKNYSDYKYIQQYYVDIKDFSQTENQPILYGQHALRKWIESFKPTYPLHDSIIHTGASLLTELSSYDTSKLFVVVFIASWHKPSKSLMNQIYTTKSKVEKEKKDLFTKYSNRVNFVYVDIDTNRGLASAYNVSSIPFIYFIKIHNGVLSELSKIKGGDNVYENIKLIEKEIIDILRIK